MENIDITGLIPVACLVLLQFIGILFKISIFDLLSDSYESNHIDQILQRFIRDYRQTPGKAFDITPVSGG